MSKSIILLGAGGHAKVVADICLAAGHQIAGFLDDEKPAGLEWVGGKVVGRVDRLADANFAKEYAFVPALGDNALRRSIVQKVIAAGAQLQTVVHPSAVISTFASIGNGTVVMAGVIVNAATRIGDFCILNTGCTIDHDCVLEDGSQISPGAHLAGHVHCGKDVFIGTGAAIIPRITVADRAIVGAGSTVTGDVPADVTVVGNPAE
ncbi:MAG TPA: acetyltransferase [Rhodospirillales bacterium]|nr:acetyltransferase [Rhodospirillales bacterium]